MSYPDSILFNVNKPAVYCGGEWNSLCKDWQQTDVKIAISYPDTYEIGMSNMALSILYSIFNRQPGVLAERVFAPRVDMAAAITQAGIPLLSLESKHPLGEFDVIGFSLGYELTFTNVLNMLHLAHIPVLAAERNEEHPLVIAGGSCVLNPEPMADFIDLFVIGEAEELLAELVACLRKWKLEGLRKEELLKEAAAIPGVYVPGFYNVEYDADGLIKSITPNIAEARPTLKRQIVSELPPTVTDPVVPFVEVIHDRGAIEISRGCSRGCRFCNAGIIYRPVRQRPPQEVLAAVEGLITDCGYDEISLVSLSTSDYCNLDKLIGDISRKYEKQPLAISLPSLRISQDSLNLIESLPSRRKTGLTFAPEAGSQRLQRVINKCIPEEELLTTAAAAFKRGWLNLKLYFMLGLPTETEEDIHGIISLVEKVRAQGKIACGRKPQLRLSFSTFVPKPHTPFQWVAMDDEQQLDVKQQILKSGLHRKGIRLSWQDTKTSLLEAVFARGDRRLGKVIHRAWQMGAVFDGWSEHFNYAVWQRAFEEAGIEPDFYARRQRPLDEILPWQHIDSGISPDFLKREYRAAMAEELTADCRSETCNACGLEKQQPACRDKQG